MNEKEREKVMRDLYDSFIHDCQHEKEREEMIELTMQRGYSETDTFVKGKEFTGPKIRLVMIKGEG